MTLAPRHLPAAAGAPFETAERCTIRELLNDPAHPGASLAEATVAPGITTELHALGVDETYMIREGRGRMELDGRAFDVAPGDAVLIPAGAPQRITATGPDPLVFLCLCTPRFSPDTYRSLEPRPMKIDGVPHRTIWPAADGRAVEILDQTRFPHRFETLRLETMDDAARAIRVMQVRGAPLIGATAAYGLALAMRADPSDSGLAAAHAALLATRPTAINLRWALDRARAVLAPLAPAARADAAWAEAAAICEEDVALNAAIGDHGLALLRDLAAKKAAAGRGDEPLRLLTHCNAGWLATVDWGTATAPIYKAHDAGLPVHVWVDETRPRLQGAFLTAWELGRHGVPHAVVTDNAGGHLMQRGLVDAVIVGTDRVTASGDVCNKIGTYLKALAARDNGVPFWVALPSPTIDFTVERGEDIPIEMRDGAEVARVAGLTDDGRIETVDLLPPGSPVENPAFDVTPARLVDALITERGVCPATRQGIGGLFPDRAAA